MDTGSPRFEELVAEVVDGSLRYGSHTIWEHLNLSIYRGEFVAILGPNGAGKTSLLKVFLGQHGLSEGRARIEGQNITAGSRLIGYIPQQKAQRHLGDIRGIDLVGMGLDGDRWGFGWRSSKQKQLIQQAIAQVGAEKYASRRLSAMSGGEQQRLRIAQAIITQPKLLLCDEPLLSLDIHRQKSVVQLIDRCRREQNMAVLFVTHEINPVLPYVDKVVYVARGKALVGTPEEVIRGDVLSALYEAPVEVIRKDDRVLIFTDDDCGSNCTHELEENDDDC